MGLALLCGSLAGARAPVVVIDPGHGGTMEGALGPAQLHEKTLALALCGRLRLALEQDVGARVVLTRERDEMVRLADRVAFANERRPDLFISIHANSMPTQRLREHTDGIETFFLSANASGEEARKTAARENAEGPSGPRGPGRDTLAFILADLQRSEAHGESSRLAYAVHQQLVARTHASDRGVQQAPFYVLTGVEAPAILVEVGFISHPGEGKRLADPAYQDTLAHAIAAGVKVYLTRSERLESRPPPRSAQRR